MYVSLFLELLISVSGSVPSFRYARTSQFLLGHYPPVSVRKFGDHSLRNLRGAPEFCETLLRAVGSLLNLVRPDGSTKGSSSEGSINIDIRLTVRKLCRA
jgi:hypothetical protein